MEPTEIQEFSKQMKEAGEASLTRISLAISILAVLVAMVTVLSHRSHTEAVLLQSRANDSWEEYQSRKLRTENLQVTVDLLTLQPVSDAAAAKKKIDDYNAKIAKWNGQLSDDLNKAKGLESEVETAEARAAKFDLGEALLQIAVVLSSITLFTRKNAYYFFGLAVGAAGIVVTILGVLIH
jgi:hypothetical protein